MGVQEGFGPSDTGSVGCVDPTAQAGRSAEDAQTELPGDEDASAEAAEARPAVAVRRCCWCGCALVVAPRVGFINWPDMPVARLEQEREARNRPGGSYGVD